MPLKDYRCPKCEHEEIDLFQPINSTLPMCPKCHEKDEEVPMLQIFAKGATLRIGKGDNSASSTPKKFKH